MNTLQNIAAGEDQIGGHKNTAKLHKRLAELRDALNDSRAVVQVLAGRIAQLERELALYHKTHTAEVLTPAGEQTSWPRYQPERK